MAGYAEERGQTPSLRSQRIAKTAYCPQITSPFLGDRTPKVVATGNTDYVSQPHLQIVMDLRLSSDKRGLNPGIMYFRSVLKGKE